MNTYHSVVRSIAVKNVYDPLFSETSTIISIDDAGSGPFLVVKQDDKQIGIRREEWNAIRSGIDRMFYEIELMEDAREA